MGMSANQARFLSLTSRQVDLEYRMQQICHRRLRLASELEKVATKYNNILSDRKLFASNQAIYEPISSSNLQQLGFSVINSDNQLVDTMGVLNTPALPDPAATIITSEAEFLNLVSVMNGGDAAATAALAGNYVLSCDIDLSDNGTFSDAVIEGDFNGTFDGQGHTVSGMTISSAQDQVGLFSVIDSGTVKNIAISDSSVSGVSSVGALAGRTENGSIVENTAVINTDVTGSSFYTGGLIGYSTFSDVSYSYSTADVNGNDHVGGLIGRAFNSVPISYSYSTGDVTGDTYVAGLVGSNYNSPISYSYSLGAVTGNTYVGGLSAGNDNSAISNSYSVSNIVGTTNVGGLTGNNDDTVDATNFWNTDIFTNGYGLNSGTFSAQGLTTSEISSNASPIDSWDTGIWDMSGGVPVLIGTNVVNEDQLEQGLRNGTYSLVREADSYTQESINISGVDYEKVDWRTVATIDDDLFTANDVDAEAEYDSAVEKINSQDKKLQLEQSQIEVEHKAIITQKDAVKNILNKNIESSFKTFS